MRHLNDQTSTLKDQMTYAPHPDSAEHHVLQMLQRTDTPGGFPRCDYPFDWSEAHTVASSWSPGILAKALRAAGFGRRRIKHYGSLWVKLHVDGTRANDLPALLPVDYQHPEHLQYRFAVLAHSGWLVVQYRRGGLWTKVDPTDASVIGATGLGELCAATARVDQRAVPNLLKWCRANSWVANELGCLDALEADFRELA